MIIETGPITRSEKIGFSIVLVYFVVILLVFGTGPEYIPNMGTSSTHAGLPYFLDPVTLAELPDGHYSVMEHRRFETLVVQHLPDPDRDFIYQVIHRPADAVTLLGAGMRFHKYGNQLIT